MVQSVLSELENKEAKVNRRGNKEAEKRQEDDSAINEPTSSRPFQPQCVWKFQPALRQRL
jgi:hypothetical protein